jgi:hypothetical protein
MIYDLWEVLTWQSIQSESPILLFMRERVTAARPVESAVR